MASSIRKGNVLKPYATEIVPRGTVYAPKMSQGDNWSSDMNKGKRDKILARMAKDPQKAGSGK